MALFLSLSNVWLCSFIYQMYGSVPLSIKCMATALAPCAVLLPRRGPVNNRMPSGDRTAGCVEGTHEPIRAFGTALYFFFTWHQHVHKFSKPALPPLTLLPPYPPTPLPSYSPTVLPPYPPTPTHPPFFRPPKATLKSNRKGHHTLQLMCP